MRGSLGAVVGVFAAACLAGPNESPRQAAEKFPRGAISSAAKQLRAILALRLVDGRLGLDRPAWPKADDDEKVKKRREEMIRGLVARGMPREHAERFAARSLAQPPVAALIEQLRGAVGAANINSGTSNSIARYGFSGRGLTADFQVSDETFRCMLREESGPGRLVAFSDGPEGLSIIVCCPDAQETLTLSQSPDGAVRLAHLTGDAAVREKADSFLALYVRRRGYVEAELLPLLAHMGFALPLTAYSSEAIRLVMDLLRRPITPDDEARGRELLKRLESASYKQREAAMKALTADYVRYQKAIDAAVADAGVSEELALRARQIRRENEHVARIGELVHGLRLTSDPDYLVMLLERAGPADRGPILRALCAIAGRDLGKDVAAWKQWLAARKKT